MSKGIYCYLDKKNNEVVYVGKDSNIDTNERHKAHFAPSKYDKQQINRILQNNPDRYTYQRLWEIEDCTDNHLNEMEKYYTKIYTPKFSFTEGGDGTSGYKWTDEQKKKISGENNARYWQDKTFSEEHKKKLSEKKRGENNPNWNKPFSEETRRRMSITRSEKYNTTGFYRVSKENSSSYKKGFRWRYKYKVNSQPKSISSTDLNKLKEKVLEQGLEWYIINEENALKSLKKDKEGVKNE